MYLHTSRPAIPFVLAPVSGFMQTPPLTSHSLPSPTLHPLNTWTILFIVHIPTQCGNMHTQRLKTFQPQPQEPSGVGAIWGQGCGRLLLLSLQALGGFCINKGEREGVLSEGKGVTGRCGIGLPFPSEQGASLDTMKTLFPSFLAPGLRG